MGRGGWRKAVAELLVQGIKEQFPNGETYTPPTNKLIQIEFFFATDKVGVFFELRKNPILPSEVTENSKIIECIAESYIIVTKFAIPTELPVPESWV